MRVKCWSTRDVFNPWPSRAPFPQVSKPHWPSSRKSSRRWRAASCRSPESLAAYKRGAELLQFCQAALKDAQQQVQVFEKGVLKTFEASDAEAVRGDEP